MIKKRLIVTIFEKEAGQDFELLTLTKGPTSKSVVITPVNGGTLVLNKADLTEAVLELDKFYAEENKEEDLRVFSVEKESILQPEALVFEYDSTNET